MRKIILVFVPVIILFSFFAGTAATGVTQKQTVRIHVSQDTIPQKDTAKLTPHDLTRIPNQENDSLPKKDSASALKLIAGN